MSEGKKGVVIVNKDTVCEILDWKLRHSTQMLGSRTDPTPGLESATGVFSKGDKIVHPGGPYEFMLQEDNGGNVLKFNAIVTSYGEYIVSGPIEELSMKLL